MAVHQRLRSECFPGAGRRLVERWLREQASARYHVGMPRGLDDWPIQLRAAAAAAGRLRVSCATMHPQERLLSERAQCGKDYQRKHDAQQPWMIAREREPND